MRSRIIARTANKACNRGNLAYSGDMVPQKRVADASVFFNNSSIPGAIAVHTIKPFMFLLYNILSFFSGETHNGGEKCAYQKC